ncbi:MAG: hypothetical protein N3A61_02695, partial [Ignavibacteria bacterium]|nr:hypothetical protein [Ignavibacteria bacterium]
MRTLEVTHSELGFGNITSPSPQNEKTNVFNELLKQTQNDLLNNPTVKEIIEKRTDETNIFEHYSDITSQNYQFMVDNLDKLSEQINNFITQLKEDKVNINQKEILSYFDGIFSAFDKKYGTQLNEAFKNAFLQLSGIREYSNNGDLIKDSLKLLKNINELSNSSTLFNNRLPISKFFEQITSSEDNIYYKDNIYNKENINQTTLLNEVLEIDSDKIIKNLEFKNLPLRENITSKMTQLNHNNDNKNIIPNNFEQITSSEDNIYYKDNI